MVYRAIGVLYSYSSLVVSFSEFHENAGKWSFELKKHKAYPKERWRELIQGFIEENNLQYQVALITVHAAITGLPVITNLSDVDREFGGNGEFYKSCAQKLGMDNSSADDVNKSVYIAFMGILRWREEYNFLSSDTGAKRSSIGGAVWTGQEA
jgi:hypothetical protein